MERHDLVTTYLEATPEEETAFSRMFLLAWLLPTIVLVASIVDFLLMYVYLKYLHPFKIIIEGNVTEEAPEVADQVFESLIGQTPPNTPRAPLGGWRGSVAFPAAPSPSAGWRGERWRRGRSPR